MRRQATEPHLKLSVTYGGTLLADLVVESITWEPTSPSIGDTVTFTVTIKNQGAGRSDSSYVHYFRDGSFGAEDCFDGIPAGESVAERFAWKVTEGTHTFMAAVDPMNEIVETDDSNNNQSGGEVLPIRSSCANQAVLSAENQVVSQAREVDL